jgi:hypothetical protein
MFPRRKAVFRAEKHVSAPIKQRRDPNNVGRRPEYAVKFANRRRDAL